MRAVSKEEASICYEHMKEWAQNDKFTSSGSIGEWIFQRKAPKSSSIFQEPISNENSIDSIAISTVVEEAVVKVETDSVFIEKDKESVSKKNPFSFPRSDESDSLITMYITDGEKADLLTKLLKMLKTIQLPDVVLSTAGNKFIIKESYNFSFDECYFEYKKRARIPLYIVLRNKEESIALLLKASAEKTEEVNKLLIEKGYDKIILLDLSWAKDGVTEEELKFIIQCDTSKKQWLYHELISITKKQLQELCEPVLCSGGGFGGNYYIACPQSSDSIEYIDCYSCKYCIDNDYVIDGCVSKELISYDDVDIEYTPYCFFKSNINKYSDISSSINVSKEDGFITEITYIKDGETVTKQFDKYVKLPGKTILELWDERESKTLIAHNIYDDYFICVTCDPYICCEDHGVVIAKKGKTIQTTLNGELKKIYCYDNNCWEMVNLDDKT